MIRGICDKDADNHMKISNLQLNSKKAVKYISSEIAHICRDMEKRSPGSRGERKAAEYMAKVLRDQGGCKEPVIETFKAHLDSFYGYCRMSAVLDTVSCLGFFLHPVISLISGCISIFLFIFYFVMYKPIIDWMFPERESVNVTAIRPCVGEIKRRVFLNGHIDAAWEFTLNYHFGGVAFEIPIVMALIGITFYTVISACAVCGAGAWTLTAACWGLLFLPFFIAIWFTFNPKKVVDGANDNLSGCYMGITLLREMEQHGINLENTEVGVILTGSEEAGLRGAKAWTAAHQDEYRDVPTYIISIDTIHDPRFLAVNEYDLNGTVKADTALSAVFLQAAREVNVPCQRSRVPLLGGSTDSAAFTQGGFRSVGITGLNHKLEDYYHTRKDSYNHLNEEGLENCYKTTVRFLELIDQGVLDQPASR